MKTNLDENQELRDKEELSKLSPEEAFQTAKAANIKIDPKVIEKGILDIIKSESELDNYHPSQAIYFVRLVEKEKGKLSIFSSKKEAKTVIRLFKFYMTENGLVKFEPKMLRKVTPLDMVGTISSMFKQIIVELSKEYVLHAQNVSIRFQRIPAENNQYKLKSCIVEGMTNKVLDELDIEEIFNTI